RPPAPAVCWREGTRLRAARRPWLRRLAGEKRREGAGCRKKSGGAKYSKLRCLSRELHVIRGRDTKPAAEHRTGEAERQKLAEIPERRMQHVAPGLRLTIRLSPLLRAGHARMNWPVASRSTCRYCLK